MSKHTPGPWICQAGHGNQSLCLETESGQVLGTVRAFIPSGEIRHGMDVQMRWEEGFANARAIEAVPELIEALKALADDAHRDSYQARRAAAWRLIRRIEGTP